MYWPEKWAVSVERNVKFDTPNYILYPENYPSLPQTGAPLAPPAPPAVPPLVPPAPPPPAQQAPLPPPPQALATQAQLAPQSMLTPLSSLSRASSGGSPAMPGGLQPEAPDQPHPPPRPPSRGKGKTPTEPTRRSTRIPQLSVKEWAIQRGEGTTGEEFDEPPSEAAHRWMHPDHQHHYDSGALAADLSFPDF
ncbi:hypothetical protein V8E53_003699, partial [Lactarius tabidus]